VIGFIKFEIPARGRGCIKEKQGTPAAFDFCELRLRATGFWLEKSSVAELPLILT
jgi:hypothetical protein